MFPTFSDLHTVQYSTVQYSELSLTFTDPDECDDPTLNDCDENAICSNVQLSFTCTCREGFADAGHPGGAGRKCVQDDNAALEVEEEIAKLKRRSDRVESEVNENTKKVDENASTIEDWSYTTIAFVVIASLLLLLVCALTIYIYKVRAKSRYSRAGIYGEA